MSILRASETESFMAIVTVDIDCLRCFVLNCHVTVTSRTPLCLLGEIDKGLDQEVLIALKQSWAELLLKESLWNDHATFLFRTNGEYAFYAITCLARQVPFITVIA